MPELIINPKKTWLERAKEGIKASSPQVKQGLIVAAGTLFVAMLSGIIALISVYSDNSSLKSANSRLRDKNHELEIKVLPFRNLSVQKYNSDSAESLKKLAESMTTLHDDYSTQLVTINALRKRIDELKMENEKTNQEFALKIAERDFMPISREIENQFVTELTSFFKQWPSITNICLVVDTTEKRRRLWAEQMRRIFSEAKLPVLFAGGINMDNGHYNLILFYRPDQQKAVEEIASPFSKLIQPPIAVLSSTNEPYQISIRLMGEPLFRTNGQICFK